MESLHDQQHPDADPGIPGELDYAATATSNRDATASAVLLQRSTLPTARREEVQRLFCSVLVIRCESNAQYAAPVIVMSQEDSNIYAVLERHLKREYLLGAEKFWRLVRAELGVDTWRPRVQGAQLKALLGARLPEYEQEFQEIQRVVDSLQDCILPESSPEALVQDLRTTISQIQAWWENRNKKSDGKSLPVLATVVFGVVSPRWTCPPLPQCHCPPREHPRCGKEHYASCISSSLEGAKQFIAGWTRALRSHWRCRCRREAECMHVRAATPGHALSKQLPQQVQGRADDCVFSRWPSAGSYKRPGPAPAGFQQHASKRRGKRHTHSSDMHGQPSALLAGVGW
jgi:hypothetical protein